MAFLGADQAVTAGDDQRLVVREVQSGQVVSSLDLGAETYPIDLAVLGSGGNKKLHAVALASSDGKVTLFSIAAGQIRLEKKWTAHQVTFHLP